MKVRVRVSGGNSAIGPFSLSSGKHTIGRLSTGAITLLAPEVNATHATLEVDGAGVRLTPAAGSEVRFADGTVIRDTTTLGNRSSVLIGPFVLEFSWEDLGEDTTAFADEDLTAAPSRAARTPQRSAPPPAPRETPAPPDSGSSPKPGASSRVPIRVAPAETPDPRNNTNRMANPVAKGELPPWISPAGDAPDPRNNTNRMATHSVTAPDDPGAETPPRLRTANRPGAGVPPRPRAAPPPTPGLPPFGALLIIFVTAFIAPGALAFGGLYAFQWVSASLGQESAAQAQLAVAVVLGSGMVLSLLMTGQAFQWQSRLLDIPAAAYDLARKGGNSVDVLRRAEEQADSEQLKFRSKVSEYANIQVLVGMLLTAGWLALQAPEFEGVAFDLEQNQAGAVVPSDRDSAQDKTTLKMGVVVAKLLQLGPKAFVSTASAVASALILLFAGSVQTRLLSRFQPRRPLVLEAWDAGFLAEGSANAREAEDLAKRLARVFEEAQQRSEEARSAANAAFSEQAVRMSELVERTTHAVERIEGTAKAIGDSQKLFADVERALVSATAAVGNVSTELRSLSEGLKAHAQTYRTDLEKQVAHLQDTFLNLLRDQLGTIGSRAVTDMVGGLQKHLTDREAKFQEDLHEMARRAAAQASEELLARLQGLRERLAQLGTISEEFEARVLDLTRVVETSAGRWAESQRSGALLAGTLEQLAGGFERVGGTAQTAADAQQAVVEVSVHARQAADELRDVAALYQSLDEVRRIVLDVLARGSR